MSKLKLRKQHKIYANVYGIIERAGKWHWMDRTSIKMVTHFDCERNSLYIEAINRYYTLPFAIHDLWIEMVNINTSRLMVGWNKINFKMIHDLGPFWTIYDSLAFEKGVNKHMHYFPTVDEAMNYLMNNEIKFQVPKMTKELYVAYRKKNSDKRTFDWQLKKDTLKFNKFSAKKKRELKNKTKYTWNDSWA